MLVRVRSPPQLLEKQGFLELGADRFHAFGGAGPVVQSTTVDHFSSRAMT